MDKVETFFRIVNFIAKSVLVIQSNGVNKKSVMFKDEIRYRRINYFTSYVSIGGVFGFSIIAIAKQKDKTQQEQCWQAIAKDIFYSLSQGVWRVKIRESKFKFGL